MMEIGRSTTGLKKTLATWAKEHAGEAALERQLGGSGGRSLAYLIGQKIILSKVRHLPTPPTDLPPPPATSMPPPCPSTPFHAFP